MNYSAPLRRGRLLRRYKRFLADIACDDGEVLTAHCPNTGSMLGCAKSGFRVWLSHSARPERKYPWTWEQVEVGGEVRVGIHTGRTNDIVAELLQNNWLPELGVIDTARREVAVPGQPMRVDFMLTHPDKTETFVEAKNVTAAVSDGVALFPDAVSKRGTRHLTVLQALVESGHRAALIFCVQRMDVSEVRPADRIDPAYGQALRRARAAGVGVYAVAAQPLDTGIEPRQALPVVCP